MKVFEVFLLAGLIICALSVTFTKRMLTAIVIYMSYSLIMCVIWVILQSPDLAITEAAVGAGVTSILFFVTLKKIRGFDDPDSVLTAVEARSSSPVRIVRDPESLQSSNIKGIYPCGEGAGYAGGIMSSCIDGIKCANKLALSLLDN